MGEKGRGERGIESGERGEGRVGYRHKQLLHREDSLQKQSLCRISRLFLSRTTLKNKRISY